MKLRDSLKSLKIVMVIIAAADDLAQIGRAQSRPLLKRGLFQGKFRCD